MSQYQTPPSRAELERRYRRKSKDGFLHLLLFYILPFVVINLVIFFCVTASPKINLTVADTSDYLTTTAALTVNSRFPIKSISVNLDGEDLELGKAKNHTYTIPITKNGLLEANITNVNGMTTAQFEHIDILDDNPPSIEDAQINDGIVTLTVSDSQSGINVESVYALNSENIRVKPITADPSSGTYSFAMDPAGLHVHAQDRAGNEVQGTFTSHKEGQTETLDSDTNS